MYPHYGLLVLAYHVATGLSLPATYDQRQTGDLNVQVHLKDVQVLALLDSELLDDYTEYDYFYDYADFTVKPTVKPTTSIATTAESASSGFDTTEKLNVSGTFDTSSKNSTILTSTNGFSNANSTIEDIKFPVSTSTEKTNETTTILSTESTEGSTNASVMSETMVNHNIRNSFEDGDKDVMKHSIAGSSTESSLKTLSKKLCKTFGRCRNLRLNRRRLSLVPLAVKLVPKLLNDLARSAKNLAQDEVYRMHSN